MEHYIFPIFVVLLISVIISWKFFERYRRLIIISRQIITLLGICFYGLWFARDFISGNAKDVYGVEIQNQLPQTLDFYLIKISPNAGNPKETTKEILHSGKIRPEHYRLERLDMENSNELWIAGFLGKGNMVYFSQYLIPNKNMDTIIEVDNYLMGSKKLSEQAKKDIDNHINNHYRNGVLITLSILFIFINLYILPKKLF